jgi:threonine dehydratase
MMALPAIAQRIPEGIDVGGAEARLRRHIVETPLFQWRSAGIWLKCENEQLTGSFKLRGALNKVLSLSQQDLARGLVAASAGNHGIGVALAATIAGAKATVVVPENVVERKRRALQALGAEVRLAGGDYAVAEREGHALAAERGSVWVSPYNDPEVIAGQGTLGLELARQMRERRTTGEVEVYVPVSGGGLLAGVGLGLRLGEAPFRLLGVQTESAPYFYRFLHGEDPAGVVERPTLADGLAGAVEAGSITWDLVRQQADDSLLVSEEEIGLALLRVHRETGMLIEPSAAVAVAACLEGRGAHRVAIISGGNADPSLLERLAGG